MMENNISYKEAHENFMKNHNGTTILENFILISSGPVLVFINCFILHFLAKSFFVGRNISNILIFLLDFSSIIFPLVLNFTVFSESCYSFITVLLTIYLCILVSLLASLFNDTFQFCNYLSLSINKPFITYFRSIVNIITAICILAVDFNIFPRRFAKTENFGFGLMDTGVGFYIVTNAIVVRNNSIKTEKLKFLIKSCVNVVPLLILGAVRFFSITAMDYQTHTSEYGVHWNFFFTLAAVKLLSTVLLLYFGSQLTILTIATSIVHQYLLSFHLEQWALSTEPRLNYISANREGISSLLGYVNLYFASLILGKTLRKITTVEHRLKYLTIFTIVLISLTSLLLWSESYFPNSRRLANITYTIWILSLSVYIIVICFVFELSLELFYSFSKYSVRIFTPKILEAINYNSLTFFLIANLFTGLVNMWFQTLYLDNAKSVVVITCYMFATCSVTNILYIYKIRLKWW